MLFPIQNRASRPDRAALLLIRIPVRRPAKAECWPAERKNPKIHPSFLEQPKERPRAVQDRLQILEKRLSGPPEPPQRSAQERAEAREGPVSRLDVASPLEEA